MIFWSYHCSFYLSDPDVSRPQFNRKNPRKSELERRPSRSASRQRCGDRVRCRKSEHQVKLFRTGSDFFQVLRSKLKWGEKPS